MPTKKKSPEDKKSAGRPSLYKPEFCEKLITHSKQGGSFESFAATISVEEAGKVRDGVDPTTLYNWLEEHPEFFQARKTALAHLMQFYENMGKTLATGQLRRLKSEEPVLDKHDKPVMDPTTGKPLIKRTYEPAQGSATAWIFLTKNLMGWRDRKDIELSGKEGGPINFSNMSDVELKKELLRLQEATKKALEQTA